MSAIPSWPEILDAVLTSRLRSVHTALPGTIRSYSEADQTAEVELAVQLEVTLEQFARVPNLQDVPVAWPGAWSNGDKCLLIFAEESFAKWFDSGSVEPPDVLQRHGLHAFCVPLVALAGQTVQFVALSNLVTATLTDLVTRLTAWQAALAALPPATAVTNSTLATAVDLLLDPALIGWPASVAATKVKAR